MVCVTSLYYASGPLCVSRRLSCSSDEFRDLFGIMSRVLKFEEKPECVEYLINTHYLAVNRPFRLCQPRDLLLQVRNYCNFHQKPLEISNESFDFAVDNYFSIM